MRGAGIMDEGYMGENVTDSILVEFAKREVEIDRERDFCYELDYAVNVTLREYWGEMSPLERYDVTVFPALGRREDWMAAG